MCQHSTSVLLHTGLAVTVALVIGDRRVLRRENNDFRNTTLYAERNTCPRFLDKGQAVLESDRVPSSSQPNLFEELTVAEMAAVSPIPRNSMSALEMLRNTRMPVICGAVNQQNWLLLYPVEQESP